MLATITIRWVLIYFCVWMAVAPLLFQYQVGLQHIGFAILALWLIYTAPIPKKED